MEGTKINAVSISVVFVVFMLGMVVVEASPVCDETQIVKCRSLKAAMTAKQNLNAEYCRVQVNQVFVGCVRAINGKACSNQAHATLWIYYWDLLRALYRHQYLCTDDALKVYLSYPNFEFETREEWKRVMNDVDIEYDPRPYQSSDRQCFVYGHAVCKYYNGSIEPYSFDLRIAKVAAISRWVGFKALLDCDAAKDVEHMTLPPGVGEYTTSTKSPGSSLFAAPVTRQGPSLSVFFLALLLTLLIRHFNKI